MQRLVQFTIESVPVAQPRQRHSARLCGGKILSRNYLPKEHPVHAFKAAARLAAARAMASRAPFDVPLSLIVRFVMPRPKGMIWKKRPMPRTPHTKTPDADNLVKALCDALNALVWRDDSLVWCVDARKVIASGTERPHVEVSIWNDAEI